VRERDLTDLMEGILEKYSSFCDSLTVFGNATVPTFVIDTVDTLNSVAGHSA